MENIDEILKKKSEILRDLKSPNKKKREDAWNKISYIVETGNTKYLKGVSDYLRSLLWNKLQGVRDDAWNHLIIYKTLLITGIERGLTANSDRIKWSAWSHVLDMINLGLIDKDKVIEIRNSYWRLLRSRWVTIRKKAWKLFVKLVQEGIFLQKDKERFFDFLRHSKASVRIYAWETSLELLQIGYLTKDELLQRIEYLKELTKMESSVKKRALKVLKRLGV